MLLPTFSKGTPEIPAEVYEKSYKQWRQEVEANTGYTKAAFEQEQLKDTEE